MDEKTPRLSEKIQTSIPRAVFAIVKATAAAETRTISKMAAVLIEEAVKARIKEYQALQNSNRQ